MSEVSFLIYLSLTFTVLTRPLMNNFEQQPTLFYDTLKIAVLEWTIAFGFTFYLLTFFFDLRMSKGVARGELSRERLLAKKRRQGNGEPMREVNLAGENPTIPTAATAATAADVHRDGVPNSEAVVGHNSV